MPELIIMPDIKTKTRKAAESALTVMMWSICLYFFIPVLDMSLHLEGDAFALEGLKKNMTKIGITLAVSFALFSAWRYYNYLRFGKKDRRRAVCPVSPERVARLFNMTQAEILRLRDSKEAVSGKYEYQMEKTPEPREGLLFLSYLENVGESKLTGGERAR